MNYIELLDLISDACFVVLVGLVVLMFVIVVIYDLVTGKIFVKEERTINVKVQ